MIPKVENSFLNYLFKFSLSLDVKALKLTHLSLKDIDNDFKSLILLTEQAGNVCLQSGPQSNGPGSLHLGSGFKLDSRSSWVSLLVR